MGGRMLYTALSRGTDLEEIHIKNINLKKDLYYQENDKDSHKIT